MRTTILFLFTLTIITSCTKKTLVEKNLLYGNWEYTKAEEVKTFSKNIDLISEYNDIEVFINHDESFTWKEGTYEGKGFVTLEKESGGDGDCSTHDDLVFHFDDGSIEMFHTWISKKRKNKMDYCSLDGKTHFTLTKKTVSEGRRNPNDPVIDPNKGNSKGDD